MAKDRSKRGTSRAGHGKRTKRATPARRPERPTARVHGSRESAGAPLEDRSRSGAGVSGSTPPSAPDLPPQGASFPIVGIGASAGGLEALEEFLAQVPAQSGMAFVVVQHLDPSHNAALAELLQRVTKMPVAEITDGLKVRPDSVYIIPPGKDLSILHGVLHLLPTSSPAGLNLPIDFFFRSLAADQQEGAVAVILSGMGSDGTLGLRAIKEKAGATFVQSLNSAKFQGMPRSAIDSGLADVVAPARELPGKIVSYRRHVPPLRGWARPVEERLEDKTQSGLEKVFLLLRAQTGNDFSLYKRSTIYRRIERRMGLHQIDELAHYVRYLRENRREIELLFKELLIGVTSFFREPAAWEYLKTDVLPALISVRAGGGVLRAWVPGCSTGEEAYTLAMTFREAMEPFQPVKNLALQIFATDLDRDAIERARQALYPDNIAADVSPERLRRFFVQEDRGFRVGKEIREMVVFAPQNVIMDPPFTKLDILSCRNLLIYLSAELQKKLIPLFHYSLNPGGILFLGSAETIGAHSNLFAPLNGKTRIYRRLDHSMSTAPLEFPTPSASSAAAAQGGADAGESFPKGVPPNIQMLADRVIVQRFAPVGILCNDGGDILYVSGRTGKYLEPAVGKANLNVFAMAREGLRYELSRAFSAALREQRAVTIQRVKVGTNGGTQVVDLTVQQMTEPRELRGTVMVIVADVQVPPSIPARKPTRAPDPSRMAELEREAQHAREEAQTTREEMQTSQEELKSTNEELQSTNEELQSTNEELTTSKEEMQSLNEELQTVNHELQAKVDELSRSNNDMKNLLNSTDIATLFLDGNLRVRRFTTPTSRIIKLIPGDAGRPITDIATDLEYADLAGDAREVLRTLVFKEKQVATRDGRWFVVRIMPYRTLDNVIDGVVVTFTDASASRTLEAALREQTSQVRQVTESLPVLVWGGTAGGSCDTIGRQWTDYTGAPDRALLGFAWLERIHPEDRERAHSEWRTGLQAGRLLDFEMRIRSSTGTYRWFKARAAPIRDPLGDVTRWYGTNTDVDDLKRAEAGLRISQARLELVLASSRDAIVLLETDLSVAFVGASAEKILGRAAGDVINKGLFEAFPQLRGTGLEKKIGEAVDTDKTISFHVELGRAPSTERYAMRILPQRDGAGVCLFFLERPSST